jgi:hypothetical protein
MMRQAATGAFLVLALLATVSGFWLPAAASTLPTVHGIGAAAIPDAVGVLDHNPALLAEHDVSRLSSGLHSRSQLHRLQGEWILPSLSGPHWGLGLQQQRAATETTAWLRQVQVGLGQRLGKRWSVGTSLDLWDGDHQRDFAAHAGVAFAARHTTRTQLHLAAVGGNLLEAAQAPTTAMGRRRLDLAAALHHSLTPVWSVTTSAGFRSGRNLRRSASMAAVLRWQERLECGVGWQENVPHLALGWRNNVWSVGWSLALESEVQTHDVAVSWKWGPSLTARRAQLQQRQNDTIQTQAELAVAVFQTQQLEQWKRFAGEAFDTGDLERAASFPWRQPPVSTRQEAQSPASRWWHTLIVATPL